MSEAPIEKQAAEMIRAVARRVRDIAWEIPAPNSYTPRLMELAIAAEREAELLSSHADRSPEARARWLKATGGERG